MDEDEEVDILTDPSVSIPLVSDLLECDYTVHPQWLLDKPSTDPNCWYDSSNTPLPNKNEENLETLGHITTENAITDESGWTEKEKTLLQRGIEIFGKSADRLAQFIGTKNTSEINYYLKCFYTEHHLIHSSKKSTPDFDDALLQHILIDSEIPCTSEQVVGEPNLQVSKKSFKFKKHLTKKRAKIGFDCKKASVKMKKQTRKKRPKISVNIKEEIIKIQKKTSDNSDSDDVDVDVEDLSEFPHENVQECSNNFNSVKVNIKSDCEDIQKRYKSDKGYLSEVILTDNRESVMDQLYSPNIPKCDLILNNNSMNDLEKFMYKECFPPNLNRTRSFELYLLIRNHIVSTWKLKKPQYVTRVDIQRDLNVHIDKTSLNKIHTFLEQIGAINYGCGRVRYLRPLYKLIRTPEVLTKLKRTTKPRRLQKKFLNNGEGGCTVSHGANGEIIETTIINEDPSPPKVKIVKKQPTYLVFSKPFLHEYKFKVKMDISVFILMDFHAHSSLSEVMGLIGGHWKPESKTLWIKHYEPCKNLASSTTHCDMCPVSQAHSAEQIRNLRMSLLGWFHSHPSFQPEPSQQDLNTQQDFQKWIGFGKPCVGVILAPFSRRNVITQSDYRCLVVEKLQGDEIHQPYKFKVEIQCENFSVDQFLDRLVKVFNFIKNNGGGGFNERYMHEKSLTYLDKFIESTKVILEKYFDEKVHMKIVKGIQDICKS